GSCGGSGGYTHINENLSPLATAELVPGQGLGPIVPGEMTLSEAVQNYGPGHVSIVFGDEITAIDLAYASQQLHLHFQIGGQQAYDLATPLRKAARDLEGYLELEPGLKDIKLSGLAIAMPPRVYEGRAPWWQGKIGETTLGGSRKQLVAALAGQEETSSLPMLIPGQKPNMGSKISGFPGVNLYAHLSDPMDAKDLAVFAYELAGEVENKGGPSMATVKSAISIGEPRILRLTQMAPTHY
ncbi:MAG: hypothetical protein AAF368_20125, partial [Planctomycetota bacterium]